MDELLRYSLFNIAFTVLLFELSVIGLCFAVIVGIKLYFTVKTRIDLFVQNQLSGLMMQAVASNQNSLPLPFYLQGFRNLLKTMNTIETKITDRSWDELKDGLIKTYLLKQAKKWALSRFWTKRFLSAQCFLLNPSLAKREELSTLLNDSKLLIRIIAARAIAGLNDRDLFEQVIFRLSKEGKLARFTYRDFLIKVDEKKFEWILEILRRDINIEISAVCLDLLSTRTTKNVFAAILPFIYGSDRECRLLAVKILKNIPSGEAFDILFHCLKDEDWEIRAEALKTLAPNRQLIQKGIEKIENLLHDPVWLVRLQAALALKKLGNQGFQILSRINPEKEPEAYEISRYVFALPEA